MKVNKELNSAITTLIDFKCALPGKVREISVTCGTPGCKCMRKNKPEKHTARQMSYTHNNKTKAFSVRKTDAARVGDLNLNYKKIREAISVFAHENTEMIKKYGLEKSERIIQETISKIKRKSIGLKPESQHLRDARISRDKWKTKALKRQSELADKTVRIRDVEKSRDNWKSKALSAQSRLKDLQKEAENMAKQVHKLKKTQDSKKNS